MAADMNIFPSAASAMGFFESRKNFSWGSAKSRRDPLCQANGFTQGRNGGE
jgi:hypothetical protein